MREDERREIKRKYSLTCCAQRRNGKYDFKIIVLYRTYMFYALILVSNSHYMFHQEKNNINKSDVSYIFLLCSQFTLYSIPCNNTFPLTNVLHTHTHTHISVNIVNGDSMKYILN